MRLFCLHLAILLNLFPLWGWAYDIHDNAIMHAHQGEAFLEREHYAEAIAEFKIAISLNPDSPFTASLYNNIGLAQQKSGNYSLALQAFQKAIRLQPGFELYYKNMVHTYQLSGQSNNALGRFKQITHYNPDNAEAWYFLGLLYEGQQKPNEAKKAFIKFIDLEPYSLLAEAAKKHI